MGATHDTAEAKPLDCQQKPKMFKVRKNYNWLTGWREFADRPYRPVRDSIRVKNPQILLVDEL